jgi:hypothetical protein
MKTIFHIGDIITIVNMKGEPQMTGVTGEIEYIDGIGQLHGTWGSLAVIPNEDEVEIVRRANE